MQRYPKVNHHVQEYDSAWMDSGWLLEEEFEISMVWSKLALIQGVEGEGGNWVEVQAMVESALNGIRTSHETKGKRMSLS
jgi:hypothetical protein